MSDMNKLFASYCESAEAYGLTNGYDAFTRMTALFGCINECGETVVLKAVPDGDSAFWMVQVGDGEILTANETPVGIILDALGIDWGKDDE